MGRWGESCRMGIAHLSIWGRDEKVFVGIEAVLEYGDRS